MITTTGIFSNQKDAVATLVELWSKAIHDAGISFVYIDMEGEAVKRKTTKDSLRCSLAQGLGVSKGLVQGLGHVVASGKIATLLGFTGMSPSVGFLKACIDMGIIKKDSTRLQEYLLGGDILIVVSAASKGLKDIFTRMHAREVQEYIQ
jgi:hypothetical protein